MITQAYKDFSRSLEYQLEDSDGSAFPNLLYDIANAAQEVYLDIKLLFNRWGDATGCRGPQPVLDILYEAYAEFCDTLIQTSRAINRYVACCSLVFDPTSESEIIGLLDRDPDTALKNFNEQYTKLHTNIEAMAQSWELAGHLLQEALRQYLRMPPGLGWVIRAESIIFPWSCDSQCVALRADLSALMKRARKHLATFGKQVLDADMSSDPARRTVYTARLIEHLLRLFEDYESGMSVTAGRGMPDRKGCGNYCSTSRVLDT
ncbi:hypothetical protein B0H13DRAFT_1944003 [Mycena leptocephala]|nr:hypothetical protein B0H13DRAFT_1944003 [Mycena leptocephala]